MILNKNVFFIGGILLDSVMAMQLWLSSKNLQNTSGFEKWISKINYTSLVSAIKGIMLIIAWPNVIYSASVVIKPISVCNLLHHNTGHPAYVITYTIRDMEFSALLASSWAHPPAKVGIYVTIDAFLFVGLVNYKACG